MEIQNSNEVVETPEGAGTETPPVETPENVSSKEVKLEPNGSKDDLTAKMQSQIENLNIALKQEREAKSSNSKIIEKLEKELAETRTITENLKKVFVPEQPEEPEAPQQFFTQDQLEEFWRQKEEEKENKLKEQSQIAAIKNEVADMEKTWDGKDGKPKYNDDEVVEWQRVNGKLNLTPKAAFLEMKHAEIIDYEVSQRLAKKPNVQNVERPGGAPAVREPKDNKPTSAYETRRAVEEAIENAMAENNN